MGGSKLSMSGQRFYFLHPASLALDLSLADHDVENLHVGVLHAHTAHVAHTGDRLLNRILNKTLSRTEPTTLHGHVVAEDRRVHRSRNLGSTARLGTVAHDAANIAQRIGNGGTDLLVRTAAQPGDGSARTAGGTDGTAKSGKRANLAFNVHGNEVGQHDGTHQTFMVAAQELGIFHNGERAGDALIARSAYDNHRQRATIHASV